MIKYIIKLLSGLFPSLFVKLAFDKLANPQMRKLRERENQILKTAHQSNISFKDFTIKTYHWPGSKEGVLLIHGWEGQAGNFADLIVKLREADYNIYAFDAPSHGFSSKGKTSLFEFTELVAVLIRRYKVRKLISHSFGGVATTYALYKNQDIEIDKYVLLTTPDKFSERIKDVSIQYGINEKVINRLKAQLEEAYQIRIDELNVSNFAREVKVGSSIIIHDKNDKVIPIARAKNVFNNWKQASFREVEGTGHFRILRADFVLAEVINFIR